MKVRGHVSFEKAEPLSPKKKIVRRTISKNSSRPSSKNSRATSSRSSSRNSSRPTTASSGASSATSRPSTPGVCREHSYCYKPSNPSYYPVGLPWASGKLKCIPGYCNYDYKRADEKPQKKQFVRTLRPVDPIVKEELGFFLRMATLAGDYNDLDFYQKMQKMRHKMKYRR